MMNKNSENYQIIGFDLGHGKTSLASVSSNGNEPPEILEIKSNLKFVMTVLAYDLERLPLIGDDAFEYAQESQVQEFYISFKKSPDEQEFLPELITEFVKVVYSILKKSNQLDYQVEEHFFIGHPSGWLKVQTDKYKQLMSDAGLPNVTVVPESRAAFMHAYKSNKLKLKIREIKEGILIIDIGSSTTDLTFATDKKVEDFGEHSYALGASLIDKEIFKRNRANHGNKDKLDQHFENNPNDIKKVEIRCRKVKEKYFSNIDLFKTSPCTHYDAPLQRDLQFNPEVNYEMMQSILDTKLPNLDDKSWKEAFRHQLTRAKQKFEEKAITPSKILVTGGGARMNFIEQICQQLFPDSPYQRDTEPEVCVAKGLASWGKLDVKTAEFKKEIDRVLQDNLKNIVENNFNDFKNKLANLLADVLLDQVLRPSLIDFRKQRINGKNNLELELKKRSEACLKDIRIRKKIIKQLSECIKVIEKELEQKIDPICNQYKLQRGILEIEQPKDPITFDQGVVEELKHIEVDPVELAKSITTVASIFFGGATFVAIIIIIEMAFEVLLAGITSGLSLILSSIFIGPLFKKIALNVALSDNKIKELIQENKSKLSKRIKQEFNKKPELFEKIIEVTKNGIKTAINNKVDDARILLY